MKRTVANPDRNELLSLIGFDKNIVSAQGHYLIDDKGERYLDFSAQFGAMGFGHNNERITSVLREHLSENNAIMVQPFRGEYVDRLADKFLQLLPENIYEHVAFSSTGTEAVEAALKLAKVRTNRKDILSTKNSFHGKTHAALCATGNNHYQSPFLIDLQYNQYVPYGDINELEVALKTRRFAAFIVEPVQGEGGMVTPPAGYLEAASQLCERYNTLLIVDEIQTGLGRTGKLFACEYSGVLPDIILVAKNLSGGVMPISAAIVKYGVWHSDFGLLHSSTFANNNLAARVGLEVLNMLSEDGGRLLEHVRSVGQYLKDKLQKLTQKYPSVYESSDGLGLMHGLKLSAWSGDRLYMMSFASTCGYSVPIVTGFLLNQYKIICLPTLNSNRVLRVQPALTITKEEIDRLYAALDVIGVILLNNLHDEMIDVIVKRESVDLSRFIVANEVAISADEKNDVVEQPKERHIGNFAFFMHPTSMSALNGDIALGDERFTLERRGTLEHWIADVVDKSKDQFDVGIAFSANKIKSSNNGYVNGYLISCLLTPEDMLKLSFKKRKKLFDAYFECVDGLDVNYVGLGAYTSIISQSGSDLLDRGFSITTGNSVTSIACSRSLVDYANRSDKKIAERVVGIVGASGSVGRLAALEISEYCKGVKLIGNPKNKFARYDLANVAGEIIFNAYSGNNKNRSPLYEHIMSMMGSDWSVLSNKVKKDEHCYRDLFSVYESCVNKDEAYIDIDADLSLSAGCVDAMICASSKGGEFIDVNDFKDGTIICDAAQPPDLKMSSIQNGRVCVYSGGVMNLPDGKYRFGQQNVVGLKSGQALACLSETIALTMNGETKNRSIGRNIPLHAANDIYDIALSHGFSLHMDH